MNNIRNKYGWQRTISLPAILLLIIVLMISACASTGPSRRNDFSGFIDQPLPKDVFVYLKPGPQTKRSDLIRQASAKIKGQNRREKLYRALVWVWTNFRYDSWLNERMFERTAAEIFADKTLGGCSDYALVKVALFRAVGIPSRLVLTANVDWLKQYRVNPLAITTGHVFLEVYLEDRWYLVDSTFRKLYDDYDMDYLYYPRGELFCLRGVDYWSLNITDVSHLKKIFHELTADFNPDDYKAPDYVEHNL